MKSKLGTVCMVLGAALVIAALSLFLWNRNEDRLAGETVDEILPQVVQYIEAIAGDNEGDDVGTDEATGAAYGVITETDEAVSSDTSMTEVEIDGYAYIGYITIPALDLELPVMSEWDYTRLKIAPCRYYGSTKTDDLVIAAHNYIRHFGTIKSLSVGDAVYFTDIDGVTSSYEVAEIETLSPTSIEKMTDSGYALTLFTCTYGGQSRVTVRCNRVE